MQRFISHRFLAALFAAVLCLGLAPTAKAQLTFTVDTFNANQLTITLNPSSLTSSSPLFADYELVLVDADSISNNTWVNGIVSGVQTAPGAIGSVPIELDQVVTSNFVAGNFVEVAFTNADFVSSSTLASPYQVSFSGAGLFNPGAISNFALYWGNPVFGGSDFVLQSTMSAVGSAVPEPSTYATIFGLAALGFAAYRRRQRSIVPAAQA